MEEPALPNGSPQTALPMPLGTEVHGSARVDRARERIASDNA